MNPTSRIKTTNSEERWSLKGSYGAENRYYSKELQKFVGKTRQTFAKIKQNKEKILAYTKAFASDKFGSNASEEIELFLLLFIQKKKKKMSWCSHQSLKKELFSMLYSFNTKKMLRLMRKQGFTRMLYDYLCIPNIASTIPNVDSDIQKMDDFENWIEHVKQVWLSNLLQNN